MRPPPRSVTLRELHERIAATTEHHWHLVPVTSRSDERIDEHPHRAVLRAEIDVALAWGAREAGEDYFEAWLGNLGPVTQVRAERVLLDVLWRGSVVDRLRGLDLGEALLPFPRARAPRVKGLPDRYFARDEVPPWRLAQALAAPDGPAFDRTVHRSGLRVE